MRLSRRLKPNHFRLVVAIADHEQLSLAADYLSISQPSASRTLSELESILGAPLFIRRTKWMEPTEAGRALIRRGRTVLAELEALEQDFDNAVHGYTGQVRVGTVTGPAAGFVVPGLAQIQQRFPKIELSIDVAPSTALLRGLREGVLDFVVGRLGPEDQVEEFHLTPVANEEVSLCIGERHPLYSSNRVELMALLAYPWVMQERGSPLRMAVESAFLRRDLQPPEQVANSSSLLAMLSFLVSSDSIVPLSREVFDMLGESGIGAKVRALQIADPIVVPPAYIIRRSGTRLSRAAVQVFKQIEQLGTALSRS